MKEGEYQAYREYIPLEKKVDDVGKIVVFFSFASRESYELIYPYTPKSVSYLKYYGHDVELVPVDFYSPYDNFLAEKWCLVDLLNGSLKMSGDVSKEEYFDNVFIFMNRHQSSGSDVGDNSEMLFVIRASGFPEDDVSNYEYTGVINGLTERCNKRRKELIEGFNVTSVPSVYISGKYLINESVMSGRDSSRRDYINLIDYLIGKDGSLVN